MERDIPAQGLRDSAAKHCMHGTRKRSWSGAPVSDGHTNKATQVAFQTDRDIPRTALNSPKTHCLSCSGLLQSMTVSRTGHGVRTEVAASCTLSMQTVFVALCSLPLGSQNILSPVCNVEHICTWITPAERIQPHFGESNIQLRKHEISCGC